MPQPPQPPQLEPHDDLEKEEPDDDLEKEEPDERRDPRPWARITINTTPPATTSARTILNRIPANEPLPRTPTTEIAGTS